MKKIGVIFLCMLMLLTALPCAEAFDFGKLNAVEVRAIIVYEHTAESLQQSQSSDIPGLTGSEDHSSKLSGRFAIEWRGILRRAYTDRPEYVGMLDAYASGMETKEVITRENVRYVDPIGEVHTAQMQRTSLQVTSVSGHTPEAGWTRLIIGSEDYTLDLPGGYIHMPGKLREAVTISSSFSGEGKNLLHDRESSDRVNESDALVAIGSSLSKEIKRPLPRRGSTLTGQEIFTEDRTLTDSKGFRHLRDTVTWTIGAPGVMPPPVRKP